MNETDKLIQDQFGKLPEVLKDALVSVPWKAAVKEIATINKLSPEQTENLERETMFILYGFDDSTDYINKLTQEIPITEEVSKIIAEQVNEKILRPIAQLLDKSSTQLPVANSSVLKIAPEIHPMIENGSPSAQGYSGTKEVAHNVPHQVTPPTPAQSSVPVFTPPKPAPTPAPTSPTQQPISDKPKEEVKIYSPMKKASYPGGADPYREPLA